MADNYGLFKGLRQIRDPESETHRVKRWPKTKVTNWRGYGRTEPGISYTVRAKQEKPIGWLGQSGLMQDIMDATVERVSVATEGSGAQKAVIDLRFTGGRLLGASGVAFEADCPEGTTPEEWETPGEPIDHEEAVEQVWHMFHTASFV